MGYKTKIDWCDSTWNPVTGCLHGCEYCYARRIAKRFADKNGAFVQLNTFEYDGDFPVFDKAPDRIEDHGDFGRVIGKSLYPFGFKPTFHRYRLSQPAKWSNPRTIFVGSMTDLFGEWVPESWIQEVIAACKAAPQHRYLFLTKNPGRYRELFAKDILPKDDNFWYGSTTDTPETEFFWSGFAKTFVSIEPILKPFTDLVDEGCFPDSKTNWIIVGAETGDRKDKVIPEKNWISELVEFAADTFTPIFMKESLREIMGDDFKQEYPWQVSLV